MFLETEDVNEVREILTFYAKGLPVYGFGSRVHGRLLKKTSDLDLCVKSLDAVPAKTLRKLRGAFELSDLPVRVDVVDWHALSSDFQSIIAPDLELIWDGERMIGQNVGIGHEEQI